eukprot:CAMPEP_0194490252 /NCGR_PEP_ID=MMETSP0253-20130528/9534_1 /TAXON_ID=2966 /ORGANISM="Noctiluca scintillans" /LENGTH=214 /DNA_ID=CAMNT_0039330861 /DNA_START=33 /DNA_END=674 /DNA_ORIENTATION=+
MAGDGEMLKLKSSQGEVFEVEPEVACMSTLIKNMVDDSGTDEEIPLPNVKTAILSKVIDYCKYHKDNQPEEIQKPLRSTNLCDCGVSEWDSEYVNIEQEVLFELILAANYLDIKSLLDLSCAKVASMIKGKTTEEIRKQFNIVNDFTPEEEAQVREENRWCEDDELSWDVVATCHKACDGSCRASQFFTEHMCVLAVQAQRCVNGHLIQACAVT